MRRKKSINPHFVLNNFKANPSLIYLKWHYNTIVDDDGQTKKITLMYSTGEKIDPKYWEKGAPKKTIRINYESINEKLKAIKEKAKEVKDENPHYLTPDLFKALLDSKRGLGKNSNIAVPKFTDYINSYLQKKEYHFRTILEYRNIQKMIVAYEVKNGMVLTFDKVNNEWFKDFVKGKSYSENTKEKQATKIKSVMKEASKETYVHEGQLKYFHNQRQYEDIKVKRVKSSKFYLTGPELETLRSYNPDNQNKELVLDYFLVMCYTGLRVSDVHKLNKLNVFKDEEGYQFIRLYTYKGNTTKEDTEVVIPVLDECRIILEKYNYQLPKPLSEQKHNSIIKQVLNEAGINRIEIAKRGDRSQDEVNISDEVTNHTGRYTFINMMLNDLGVTPMELTKITGQSLDVLMGYERGDKKLNAKRVILKLQPKTENGVIQKRKF